ncbi:MAG: hypothetical protein RR276_08485 [Angelakisella sp.]
MNKKFLSGFIGIVLVLFLLPTVAYADVAPKPSVTIELTGVENQVYYVTLLSKEQRNGPHAFSTDPIDESSYLVGEHKQEDIAAWKAFREYSDGDGFYFVNFFERCPEENTFIWGYYPPSIFKVLVYFPSDNSFVVSEMQERYAFDSYYKMSIENDKSTCTVKKSYNYLTEGASLLVRVLLTIAVELLVALLFGLRKKNILLFILVVNTITQILLNVLLNLINYFSGGFAVAFHYVWMELLVILIEAVAFSIYFKKAEVGKPIKKWVAPTYAILANGASIVVGLLLSSLFPSFF